MKFLAMSLIGMIMIGGCKKENGVDGVVMEADINLYVVDENGKNLLKDGQKADGLRLYYIVDGVEKEVWNPNLDNERNFSIENYQGEGKYKGEPLLKVVANTIDQATTTKLLLKWNDSTVDTLTTELTRKGSSLWVTNIWLNGDIVWTPEIGKEKYNNGEITGLPNLIQIVKQFI